MPVKNVNSCYWWRECYLQWERMDPGGTREGRGSWQLKPTEKFLSDSHTHPVSMGRVVGLEKIGKGWNEGESRQRLLGISLLAGGIREEVVEKSRRWCSSESGVSFVLFSSHFSTLLKLTEKQEHHDLQAKREVSKSKCRLCAWC